MEIKQETSGGKGCFFIDSDEKRLALLEYSIPEPGFLIILHTEVDESLKGKNIGTRLIDRVAGYAREQRLTIRPACPFARAVFEKNKALYADLL